MQEEILNQKQQDIQPELVVKNKSDWGKLVVGVILGVVLISLIGVFGWTKGWVKVSLDQNITLQKTEPKQNSQDKDSQYKCEGQVGKISGVEIIGFKPLPDVNSKAYPVVKEGMLYLASLDNPGEVIDTKLKVEWGMGAQFLGENQPQVSPDLKKIAYIKESKLWLMTPDGKNQTQVDNDLKVTTISAWSPDSKYLVVYSPKDTIEAMYEGMMPEESRAFNKDRMSGGYYLVDTNKGNVISLYPIVDFWSFISDNTILTSIGQSPHYYWYEFNVETYEATKNQQIWDGLGKYFGVQISAINGVWALGLGNTGSDNSNASLSKIVLAKYPSIEGKEIDAGAWADVQQPVISPKGDKLIYEKKGNKLMYWDGNDKKELTDGNQPFWVDEDRFVYENKKEYFVYDLKSMNSTKLM